MAKKNMSIKEMGAEVTRLEKQIKAAAVQEALKDIVGSREFKVVREKFGKLGTSAQIIGQLFTTARVPSRRHPSAGVSVPPGYQHPENAELRWTGRGRKPKWVEQRLAEGPDYGRPVDPEIVWANNSSPFNKSLESVDGPVVGTNKDHTISYGR